MVDRGQVWKGGDGRGVPGGPLGSSEEIELQQRGQAGEGLD